MIVTQNNRFDTHGLGKLPSGGTNVPTRSFWGRLLRKVVNIALTIVENSGPVGSWIGGEIRDEINPDWLNRIAYKEGTYEPTPSEEAIILSFMNNKFIPFYKTLMKELDNAIANRDLNDQLIGINNVKSKMCVVSTYFANNNISGLSHDAVLYRLDTINECFNIVNKAIDSILANNANSFELVPATTVPVSAKYFPLIVPGTSFNCQNYSKIGSANLGNNQSTLEIPDLSNGNSQTVVKSSDNTGMWITIFVVGAVLVSVLSAKEDEETEAKQ